jgi:threonine dehydratase
MSRRPDLEAVRRAASAIEDAISRTPLTHSRTLSDLTGAEVWLKFENLQYTASFKERGALNRLLQLSSAQKSKGVLAVSAGNHAQAVAYHAARLGIESTIVMPRPTPNIKVQCTRELGASVELLGADFAEAQAHVGEIERERGLVLIHPFNDPDIIAGQGTVAIEILEDGPEFDALIVPVGGGGLVSGVGCVTQSLAPEIELIGVQSALYPGVSRSLAREESRSGETQPYDFEVSSGGTTIAEGIAVKVPGELTLSLIRESVSDVVLVDEPLLERAVLLLLEVEKTAVEGAGAAGLAALLKAPARFAGRRVCLILSGGNIDLPVLSSIIERGLARSRRLVRLRVALDDVPGALARLSECLAEATANIVEVHHQRAFTHLPLKRAEVLLVLQTRGEEHAQQIVHLLNQQGFESHLESLPGTDF